MKIKNKELEVLLNKYIGERLPDKSILGPAINYLQNKNAEKPAKNRPSIYKKCIIAAGIAVIMLISLIISINIVNEKKYELAVFMSRGIASADMNADMTDGEDITNVSLESLNKNDFDSAILELKNFGATDYVGINEQFETSQAIVQFSAKVLLYCNANDIDFMKKSVSIDFDNDGSVCYLDYKVTGNRVYVTMQIDYSTGDVSYLRYSYYYKNENDFNIYTYLTYGEDYENPTDKFYIFYDKGKTFIQYDEREGYRNVVMASGKTKENLRLENLPYDSLNDNLNSFLSKFKGYVGYKFKAKEIESLKDDNISLNDALESLMYGLYDESEDELIYDLINNGQEYAIRMGRTGEAGKVVIPEIYNGLPVTTIQSEGFMRKNIKSVLIPYTITVIEDQAFAYTPYLTTVIFCSETLPSFGENVFIQYEPILRIFVPVQSLTAYKAAENFDDYSDIIYSKSIIDADGFAIYNNMLIQYLGVSNRVEVPEGVTEISDYALYYCIKLNTVVIPNSLISIGKYAFSSCRTLSEIVFSGDSSLTFIDRASFSYCENLININIPKSLETIGISAFEGCRNLSAFSFEEGSNLKRIEMRAFEGCISIISFNIPDGVEFLGNGVFYGCSNLEFIEIPDSVVIIEAYAFSGTKWLELGAND